MTLLRMLTFMPDDLSSAAQSQRTPSIPIKPCENQDAQRRTEPLQTVEPLSDHTHAPVNVSNLDWPQLIQQLKLSGMAKMLAQHSEATVLSAEKIALCVPDLHKHLLEKKYQEKIQTALNAYLGKSVELNFSVGSVTGLTPVVLQQREEEVKQAQAVAAIEQDPIVQQLSENFDAKLIVSSIKPIQK